MRRLILALALVAAACGSPTTDASDSMPTTTPSTTSTSTTTTSTVPSTTTTTVPAAIPIFPTTRFTEGGIYRGGLSAVDLEFELQFELPGWRTITLDRTNRAFFHFENAHTDFEPGAQVGLVAWMPNLPPSAVVSAFRDHGNVAASTDPIDISVGDMPALEFDLLVSANEQEGFPACNQRFPLVDGQDAWVEEVVACAWNRIWVVDVGDFAVSIIGSASFDALDPENVRQVTDFEPLLDDFINAITFCTEATPCDE